MTNQEKVDLINSMKVIDHSSSFGELEYVLVEYNQDNVGKLLQIGATHDEINEWMDEDATEIDISVIGFELTKAKWFNGKKGGFMLEVPEHAPEWAK